MELNETAAEIKRHAQSTRSSSHFPFCGLTGSIEYQLAAYGRRARTRHDTSAWQPSQRSVCPAYAAGSQSKETVCGRLISETIENPALVVQRAFAPEQTQLPMSNVSDQKPPEEVSSQASDHVYHQRELIIILRTC